MKHIGLARLGRTAEIRRTADGTAAANLSLAVTVYDKNADNNRGTQWVDATLWGKQAEALAPYLVKGSVHCFTLSDMRIETFKKKDGGEGVKLSARVDSVELGPRQDGGGQAAAPAPAASPKPAASSGSPDYDDDIPF